MNKALLSPTLALTLALTLAATLCACAADSYQRVPAPPQNVEISSPTVTRIYILRMPGVLGRWRAVRAAEYEHEIGQIGRDCYLCWERPAGRSLVVLTYDSDQIDVSARQTMIDVKGEPGQTYYYGISIKDDGTKALAQPLSRDEARAIIHDQQPAPQS